MSSEARTLTVRLGIEFDGSDFHGWQVQLRDRTVQGEIERAMREVTGTNVRIAGAGRTDAGCHASGQIASATLETRLTPERLRMALNAHLPRDVRIVEAAEAEPDFHARFRAMRRAYRYLIVSRPTALLRNHAWARPIRADLEALRRASRPLQGSHDFLSFSKQGGDDEDTRCSVTELRWSRRGIVTRFDIVADRFLYTMVRRVVSTVLRAAEEGGGAKAIRAALHARDRRSAAPPAPAHGLYLTRVRYPRLGWLPKETLDVAG
ncbi:MAG TPA: tRNA pseudouridine(38-40) synthase TruA [Candidatus Dormibacteraeota bacterium]|nr:tRNA pseudouridine(38-40) synthase TruA [Candidatus Dormibacteraeota bacterium]